MAGLNNDNNPIQSQVRLGPQAIQLIPGPPGPPGLSSIVHTTANFTQPGIGSNVSVSVTSTTPFASGVGVFVQGGGYYTVASITDGTTMVLTNLGIVGNLGPGGTVTSGALVVPSGPPGGSLTIEHNTGAITQRAILNLIGFGYQDDPGNVSMDFFGSGAGVAPGLPITGSATVPRLQFWTYLNPSAQATLPASPVVGVPYRLSTVGGAHETANPRTSLIGGTILIQKPDPNANYDSSLTIVLLDSARTYTYMYDDGSVSGLTPMWRFIS